MHLWAQSLWNFKFEIFKCFFDEVFETGVAFVERPSQNLSKIFWFDIMGQPLP